MLNQEGDIWNGIGYGVVAGLVAMETVDKMLRVDEESEATDKSIDGFQVDGAAAKKPPEADDAEDEGDGCRKPP